MAKHFHLRIAGFIVAMALALGGSVSLPGAARADGLLGDALDIPVLSEDGQGAGDGNLLDLDNTVETVTSGLLEGDGIDVDVTTDAEGDLNVDVTSGGEEVLEVDAGLTGEAAGGVSCLATTCGDHVAVDETVILAGPDAALDLQVDVGGEEDSLLGDVLDTTGSDTTGGIVEDVTDAIDLGGSDTTGGIVEDVTDAVDTTGDSTGSLDGALDVVTDVLGGGDGSAPPDGESSAVDGIVDPVTGLIDDDGADGLGGLLGDDSEAGDLAGDDGELLGGVLDEDESSALDPVLDVVTDILDEDSDETDQGNTVEDLAGDGSGAGDLVGDDGELLGGVLDDGNSGSNNDDGGLVDNVTGVQDPEEPCTVNCEPCTADCGPVDPEEPCTVNCEPCTADCGPVDPEEPLPIITGVALPPAAPVTSALPPAGPIGGFTPPLSGDGGLLGATGSTNSDSFPWSLLVPMIALVGVKRHGTATRD